MNTTEIYEYRANQFMQRVRDTLALIGFHSYVFEVTHQQGSYFLSAVFMAPCNKTGEICENRTRKWRLSVHMTKSEIVQTAFKCVMTSVEHEVREQFMYRGFPIFGPHYDVDKLADLMATGEAEDTRHENNN